MRVQSLAKETSPAAEKPERTGIFTTGFISQVADHTIALFFTGHRHAGENLDQSTPALRPEWMEDGTAVYNVGSGVYQFRALAR